VFGSVLLRLQHGCSTLDTHSHMLPGMGGEAATAMEDVLSQDTSTVMPTGTLSVRESPSPMHGRLAAGLFVTPEYYPGWPPDPKPEDGVWAKHWYHSVHASTTFASYQPKTEPFPERLEPLLKQCVVPLYEKLRQHAITARA
jgi:hypothetical protein